MKWYLGMAGVLATCATIAQASCEGAEIVARFSHVTDADTHPLGRSATALAARVNADLQGRMCLLVHPGAALFDDQAGLEAVQKGDLELAAPALMRLAGVAPAFKLFDLPFLFRDPDTLLAFQASDAGVAMLDGMQDAGLQGLGVWHVGMKQLSATVPLMRPSDARGLRFRVLMSNSGDATMAALGAEPRRMALPEVYAALQSGFVDGQENTWTNMRASRVFEVQDGVTESNHGLIAHVLVVSPAWLDGLPPDLRRDFLAIVAEVTQQHNADVQARNAAARSDILEAGEVIRGLGPEDRAAWLAAMAPVWAEFAPEIGQDRIDAARAFEPPL